MQDLLILAQKTLQTILSQIQGHANKFDLICVILPVLKKMILGIGGMLDQDQIALPIVPIMISKIVQGLMQHGQKDANEHNQILIVVETLVDQIVEVLKKEGYLKLTQQDYKSIHLMIESLSKIEQIVQDKKSDLPDQKLKLALMNWGKAIEALTLLILIEQMEPMGSYSVKIQDSIKSLIDYAKNLLQPTTDENADFIMLTMTMKPLWLSASLEGCGFSVAYQNAQLLLMLWPGVQSSLPAHFQRKPTDDKPSSGLTLIKELQAMVLRALFDLPGALLKSVQSKLDKLLEPIEETLLYNPDPDPLLNQSKQEQDHMVIV